MAINQKAWEAVLKYFPTHYLGSTGPCCDRCSMLLTVAEAAYKSGQPSVLDDPEMDGTDFAHPAWWRGNERAFLTAVHEVNDILDGTKANVGTASGPWQQLRQRLYDIRTLLGIAERIVGQVEYDHNSKFYLNISQWYKVRRDYAQRVQGIRAANLAKEKL